MLTQEQLKERKNQIGGSDIASIMGRNRWVTPLQLWAEKTGQVDPRDISDLEHVQLGSDLEDFVAQQFTKRTGLKVRRDSRTFKHPEHQYMVAHIDRRITGSDEILECKTCSAWKAKEWEGDDMPIEYIYQVMWYLGITGMQKAYLACLIGGQKFVIKHIEFDQNIFQDMLNAAIHFMDYCVIQGNAPASCADDSDFLVELYPQAILEELPLTPKGEEEVRTLIENREALNRVIKHSKKEIDEIDAQIKMMMGEAEMIRVDNIKITWTNQITTRVDTAKLKENGIYDEYSKSTETRVFRTSVKKEK